MKDEIVEPLTGTLRQAVGDAVVRTAEPVIRAAVDRAASRIVEPLQRELDRIIDRAARRAASGVADASRRSHRNR